MTRIGGGRFGRAGGGGGTTIVIPGDGFNTPTTTTPEPVVSTDKIGNLYTVGVEVASASELASLRPTIIDPVAAVDALSNVTSTAVRTEPVNFPETSPQRMQWIAPSRAQSAVGGSWGDTWVDAAIGQTGVNHGNETTIQVSGTVGAVKIAYMYFDLRRFSGFVADTTQSSSFNFSVSSNSLVSQTITVTYGINPTTVPFSEDTITNNSTQPTANTALTTFNANGNTGTAGNSQGISFPSLSASLVNTWLGNYVVLKFVGPTTQTGNVYIAAREYAGSGTVKADLDLRLLRT